MKILALDCATKTGWCLLDESGKIIESGVQSFEKRRGESNGLVFLRFRNWLGKLIEFRPGGAQLLVYERAHMRGGAATELCVGLQTRVQELAAEKMIESLPVPSTTLKKWATGSGPPRNTWDATLKTTTRPMPSSWLGMPTINMVTEEENSNVRPIETVARLQ